MWYCQIGFNSATKMLCTKILIYNQFLVDTGGNWCKNVITNMFYLTSKIFHLSPVVNLVLKFQNGFGDPKPQSIWFFWQISIKTKILAPESARGVEHFKCCVILGHPNFTNIQIKHNSYFTTFTKAFILKYISQCNQQIKRL